jgi:hypothetical protein
MMRLSISRSRESIWIWLFWGLGIYLALELGPCLIVARVLNVAAGELVGPYLAFAVPWAILAPLIWLLRKGEEQGASPKRLAHGWGLGMAIFGVAAAVAVFYSGIALRLVDVTNAISGLFAAVLLSAPIFYFGMYHMAFKRISSRAAGKLGGSGPK